MRISEFSRVRSKWRRWIKRISDAASMLALDDYIFRKSMEAVDNGGVVKNSNEVYRWAIRVYSTHAAIGLRRLLDSDDRTYSILLLLSKIEKNPQAITRRSFVLRYPRSQRDRAMLDFDDIAGLNAKSLSHQIVETDLKKLHEISKRVRPIVDKVIAHRERKPKKLTRPTWQELHEAIDQVIQMCGRYNLILNQVATLSMLPTINATNADIDVVIVWGNKTAQQIGPPSAQDTAPR